MIVFIHVAIAIFSMVMVSVAYARPTANKINTSYGLVALTVLSGSYMMVATSVNMLQACTSGLVYIGIVTAGIVATQMKLARIHASNSSRTWRA